MPEFLEYLLDILLFRVFSEGDNGITIDGKNTEGVSPDLLGVLHQWSALKRPHALSIGCSLGRTLIKEREYGVFAHPGKIFLTVALHPLAGNNREDRAFQSTCQTIAEFVEPD